MLKLFTRKKKNPKITMPPQLIYLAGPISDLKYDDAIDWRQYMMDRFPEELIGLSPMRGKDFLTDEHCIHRFGYPSKAVATERAIMMRDFNDVRRADAIFVNFLAPAQKDGRDVPSIGTAMEMAWAYMLNTPVIVAVPDGDDHIHAHCMLNQTMKARVTSLDEGIELLKATLLPVPH